MNENEKIALIEEMLELKSGSLTGETLIRNIAGWDSMAALSLIALFDEKFSKALSGEQILGFKTVKDITDFMG